MKVITVTEKIKKLGEKSEVKNGTIWRLFHPSERYSIDFADDFNSEGWKQYDTDQDAHYFGVWVNPVKFQVLTYAEGDWDFHVLGGREQFNAEIARMNEFYGEGFEFITIGAEGKTTYRQNRKEFYIEEKRANENN